MKAYKTGVFLIAFGFGMLIVSFSTGCASQRLMQDDYPPSIAGACVQARAESIRAQPGKAVKPVRVTLESQPCGTMGAWTVPVNGGYHVSIWEGQRPFYASLRHEMGHCFEGCSSEEAVR